uniref:uncharacterized protein LOC131138282 isoform X2 n=1 Tax=Doryrhamphus excisus TaxID=161450 RepID=UPI0025AEBF00|nr:uncharacterized protein LOC131138282 isoform X2 [Doryrhamphus excisus]
MVKLKTTMLHQCSRKTLHHTTSSAPNICCLNGLRLLFCSCVAIVLPPPRTPVCQCGARTQAVAVEPALHPAVTEPLWPQEGSFSPAAVSAVHPDET